MPQSRFVPILGVAALFPVLAFAQIPSSPTTPAATPKAEEPPTEAERLLDEAIKKVADLKTVSAELTQDVDMLEQAFSLSGEFLRGEGNRVYFKLSLAGLGDSTGTMLQVCDGTTMWDYQQILNGQQYRKFEIQPVLEALGSPDLDKVTRDRIVSSLGFAGPDALLIGLRRAIKFDQKSEGEFEGKKVWILGGTWKDREGLVGPNNQPLPPTAPLPAYIPSLASVKIGQEDGWPYEIELIGRAPSIMSGETRRLGPDGRPIGRALPASSVQPSRIRIVYTNVQLNPELKPERFAFQAPPGAPVRDTTQDLVRQFQAVAQMTAAQKKQAAQQGADPLGGLPGAGALPGLPGGDLGAPGAAPAPGAPR